MGDVVDNEEKEKFEKEREETLKALPEELKQLFGTIGFCPADEDDDDSDDEDNEDGGGGEKKLSVQVPFVPYHQPVLIISPYDVPPKPVRDIYWMDAFTKAKRSKAKLKKLDYLVYVYGSTNPNDCYHFVPQTEFVTYEEGLQRGYCNEQHPNKRLGRGLKEMKVDLPKESEDRRKDHVGEEAFLERYEENEDDGPPSKKQKT
mmetsp:Transcript_17358/g.19888  ORF Transcript_17358/g.19888 Transcript_17358/m.19888 type:complete len:203 (+) Transcript_17358:110-718(+)